MKSAKLKRKSSLSKEPSRSSRINDLIAHVAKVQAPKGPEDVELKQTWDIYKHGLSQSLIGTFRACERKFRHQISGLTSMKESQALIYGTVFHEALDYCQNRIKDGSVTGPEDYDWDEVDKYLTTFFKEEYEKSSPEGKEYYELAIGWSYATLPTYFKFWEQDFFGETEKKFIEIEGEFAIKFPSVVNEGKDVVVRGKRDGLVEENGKVWLWENKTKGTWNDVILSQVLERDLQNNTYLLSVGEDERYNGMDVAGVIYNIIRRPQLRKKKTEDMRQYLKRCEDDIKDRPEFYFARLQVEVSKNQRDIFKAQFSRQVSIIERWSQDILPKSPFLDIENTSECSSVYGACSFLGLCSSGLEDYSGLFVREKMFSELDKANKES